MCHSPSPSCTIFSPRIGMIFGDGISPASSPNFVNGKYTALAYTRIPRNISFVAGEKQYRYCLYVPHPTVRMHCFLSSVSSVKRRNPYEERGHRIQMFWPFKYPSSWPLRSCTARRSFPRRRRCRRCPARPAPARSSWCSQWRLQCHSLLTRVSPEDEGCIDISLLSSLSLSRESGNAGNANN